MLITKQRGEAESIDIARFIRGESFGEMDMLENRQMTATAVAERESSILIFPARGLKFAELLKRRPGISARILHELLAFIAGRIRSTNRIISAKSEWVEGLRRQLYHDKLTGLYNRAFLDEELPARLREGGPTASVIMIKPDRFKAINDTHGHEAGDRALGMIADGIKSRLRLGEIAVRYRGDEFALVVPGAGMAEALDIAHEAKKMIGSLDVSRIDGCSGLALTASIGVASRKDGSGEPGRLIHEGFERMLAAWEAGGDRVVSDRE
ncbi:MAG: GGDEF domain-containing protein [Chrysiogenales bacterium]|nr:MAG: GGDEF domain-containing protein [Chrysiogenales bacterium]